MVVVPFHSPISDVDNTFGKGNKNPKRFRHKKVPRGPPLYADNVARSRGGPDLAQRSENPKIHFETQKRVKGYLSPQI